MADGRIIIDTSIDDSGAIKGVKSLGGKLGSLAKTGATALTGLVASATTAVTAIATVSVKQYAEYEQLVGGVDTLFKSSSDLVQRYAANAFETAGLSANEYMSTITGFSASLLQGLGGDTKKAAQIGNKAVTDMSDNANKMGTSMESIQNAYQGFAKQNYTMLDNLKLGYGGTKEEMKRLLKDAQKLSGVKYSIGNFSDIIEAIHVVQNKMGITGTTAKEAASTIEGSFNMLKASWSNVLVGMADDNANFGETIGDLVYSIQTFGKNILPRVKVVLNGVGELFNELATQLPSLINSILPQLLNTGINVVKNLLTGIQSQLPQLATTAMEIIGSLGNAIITLLPQLLEMGMKLILQVAEGFVQALPELMTKITGIFDSILTMLIENIPKLIDIGADMILKLAEGLANNIPTLIPKILQVIVTICDKLIENMPKIIQAGMELLKGLVKGLMDNLPYLIENVPRIINSFMDTLTNNLPQIIMGGIQIILALIKGLIQAIPTLIANLPAIIKAIFNTITLFNWASAGENLVRNIGKGITRMSGNIGGIARGIANGIMGAIKGIFSGGVSIGQNLVRGLWNGINAMKNWVLGLVKGFAGSIIKSIKGIFGIHSPSRVMRDLIGKNLVRGIGVGVDIETPNLEDDIEGNMQDIIGKMQNTVGIETSKISMGVVGRVNKDNTPSTVTNNNDNGLNVTIEKFENNTDKDPQTLMEELEFYRKQNNLGKGRV